MDLTESNTPQIVQRGMFPMPCCPYATGGAESEIQAKQAAGSEFIRFIRFIR